MRTDYSPVEAAYLAGISEMAGQAADRQLLLAMRTANSPKRETGFWLVAGVCSNEDKPPPGEFMNSTDSV